VDFYEASYLIIRELPLSAFVAIVFAAVSFFLICVKVLFSFLWSL
jgi:hypothetical protein